MKKKTKTMCKALSVFLIILIIFVLLLGIYYISHKNILISFTPIKTFNTSENMTENDFAWISLISEEYNPLWNAKYVYNKYGIKLDEYINTNKYSYIVTFGRELKSISYCYSDSRTKYFGIIPKEKIGKVILSNEQTPKIYLYQIKKIDIVHDYYGNGENMVEYE